MSSRDAASRLDETAVWVHWVSKRVWNDREIDAGLLLCAMGLWMILWPQTIAMNAWAVIFAIAPAPCWGALMILLGVVRGCLAGSARKLPAAHAALLSTALWIAYSAAFWTLSPKSFGGIIFGWLGWQGFKSYLRLRTDASRLQPVGDQHGR